MTKIAVFYREGEICGFEASGHTGFSQAGSDIVCAGVSAILQTACAGIGSVLGIEARIRRNDRRGYLKMILPGNLPEDSLHDARLILRAAMAGLEGIVNEYPGYIRVTSRKWR